MKLFNLKDLLMWFHYGDCKKEIERLNKEKREALSQITSLLSQINEQNGIFDYALYEKERIMNQLTEEIARLKEEIVSKSPTNNTIIKNNEKKAKKQNQRLD